MPADRDALQGLWVMEKFDVAGKVDERESREMKAAAGKMQMVVAGDVWWGMWAGDKGNVYPQTAVLDPKKNPKWLDWRGWPGTGGPALTRCIYELDRDTLRLCMSADNDPKVRPAEFAADTDAALVIMTFRRGKTPPAAGDRALVGSWVGKEIVTKGGPKEPDRRFTPQAEILDGFLFVRMDTGSDEWMGGRYTVDVTKNPKWVDVELAAPPDGNNKVAKLYGSYEAADGRLKLVLGSKRATRPLEFKDGLELLNLDLMPKTTVAAKPDAAPMPRAKPKDVAKPTGALLPDKDGGKP